MYEVVFYSTPSGNLPVDEFISEVTDNQNPKEMASIYQAIKLLEKYGFDVVNNQPKMIKHLREGVYELRPGDNRILFFHFTGNKFILLHGFRKTTRQTPDKEIRIAIKRMKDYKRRHA